MAKNNVLEVLIGGEYDFDVNFMLWLMNNHAGMPKIKILKILTKYINIVLDQELLTGRINKGGLIGR